MTYPPAHCGSRFTFRTALSLLVLSIPLLACGASPKARSETPTAAMDPGPLRAPDHLAGDFQWRQQVTARWPSGSRSFEAVLLKRDGTLTLLGLSPMGLPGFTLTLDAQGKLHVENRTGRKLPFEPAHILADIERVFFPWLEDAPPPKDGERSGAAHGMLVRESFRDGQLAAREFTHADTPERGHVSIQYEGWQSDKDAPRKVRLDSDWFDYSLTIETLEQERL